MSTYVIRLSEQPIESETAIFLDEEGAECQFLGTVRHLEEGREIAGIDYSAYESMALLELQKLCEQAQQLQPTAHRVFIQHRLGFVAAREASIVIRVKTKHSAQSFALCQWYLHEIKTRVPIWKRPIWKDPKMKSAKH